MKRTFQPHRRRRKTVHGFRKRMQTANGRKGKWKLLICASPAVVFWKELLKREA